MYAFDIEMFKIPNFTSFSSNVSLGSAERNRFTKH